MKKLFIIGFILFIVQNSFSQVFVNDVNINESGATFIQLVGVNTSIFKAKYKIFVDYGQDAKFMKSYSIKDANGKVKKFHSMVDALNFMHDNGWDYVDYSDQVISGKIRYVYLLKRRK